MGTSHGGRGRGTFSAMVKFASASLAIAASLSLTAVLEATPKFRSYLCMFRVLIEQNEDEALRTPYPSPPYSLPPHTQD